MEDRIRLSYFYGKEADQFSFYKIPKLLFTEEYFKRISVEAKVLYGLMLDRMSLSMKNQWLDEEGRAYIYYSLEDIMDALGCSNKKAISIMKELDTDAGIVFVCIVATLIGGCWKTYDSEMQRNMIMLICFAVTGTLGAVSWCGMAKK